MDVGHYLFMTMYMVVSAPAPIGLSLTGNATSNKETTAELRLGTRTSSTKARCIRTMFG